MAKNIEVNDKKYRELLGNLRELEREPKVAVGILAKDGSRNNSSTITNVEIGTIHEFGAPEAGIRERSFLRAGIDENQSELNTMTDKLLGQIVDGKESVSRALGLIGQKAVAVIKNRIADGIAPDLKQKTIDNRKRQFGKSSSKPLVATGQLVNSITYEVRK